MSICSARTGSFRKIVAEAENFSTDSVVRNRQEAFLVQSAVDFGMSVQVIIKA